MDPSQQPVGNQDVPVVSLIPSDQTPPPVVAPIISPIIPPVIPPVQQFAEPPKKHWLSYVAVIIVLLIVGAGGVFAYYTFSNTDLSPTDIFKKSLQASYGVKSFSFSATSTGQVTNKFDEGIPNSINFTSAVNGVVDFHSLNNPLLNINFTANAKANDATTTASLSFGLNTMYIPSSLYFNLDNFAVSFKSSDKKLATSQTSVQTSVTMMNGIGASLKGKWVQLDIPNISSTTIAENLSSNKEYVVAVKDYILGLSYIKTINEVGSEIINGTPTHHLKMTVRLGQEFINLLEEIANKGVPVDSRNSKEFNDGMDSLSKFADQTIDVDIWVGQNDFLVYKTVTTPVSISDVQTETTSVVSQESVFGNYNKPVILTAPKNAMSFEEVLKDVLGGSLLLN